MIDKLTNTSFFLICTAANIGTTMDISGPNLHKLLDRSRGNPLHMIEQC